MIVKMKFLSISGPRTDIDRVSASYLSKLQKCSWKNTITELKTTNNLMPFGCESLQNRFLKRTVCIDACTAKGEMDTSYGR